MATSGPSSQSGNHADAGSSTGPVGRFSLLGTPAKRPAGIVSRKPGRHAGWSPLHQRVAAAASVLAVFAAVAVLTVVTDADTGRQSPSSTSQGHGPDGGAHGSMSAAGSDPTAPQGQDEREDDVTASSVQMMTEQCRSVWTAQSRAVRTASGSLAQWELHVDAMNQLVAGKITLAQATAFWERTRHGALARVARFLAADARLSARRPDCVQLASVRTGPAALRSCMRRVDARDELVALAARSIATWTHHIHDMDRLLAGQITPEQATKMWMRKWQKGQQQIDDFHALKAQAPQTNPCAA